MGHQAEFIALITLVITTLGGLAAQFFAMRKQELAAKLLLEQTKAGALLLAAKTSLEADRLAKQHSAAARELKEQISRREQAAKLQTQEIKALVVENQELVKENTTVTIDSKIAAEQAFHEANQVNVWRAEVSDELRKQQSVAEQLKEGAALTYKAAGDLTCQITDAIKNNEVLIRAATLVAKQAYFKAEQGRTELKEELRKLTAAVEVLIPSNTKDDHGK